MVSGRALLQPSSLLPPPVRNGLVAKREWVGWLLRANGLVAKREWVGWLLRANGGVGRAPCCGLVQRSCIQQGDSFVIPLHGLDAMYSFKQ
jgi:hypothetical protein